MNDLHFILYEPKRMYLDTSDMPCAAANAHRRLCDFIWINDLPPVNQSKILKQITLTEKAEWPKVKRELLRKGWLEMGAYLLHRGVIKTLNESKVKYVENFNRQAKMNKQIPKAISAPDIVTGIVTIIVTPPATASVTKVQSESQPESESEAGQYSSLKGEGKGKGERGKGAKSNGEHRSPGGPQLNIERRTLNGEGSVQPAVGRQSNVAVEISTPHPNPSPRSAGGEGGSRGNAELGQGEHRTSNGRKTGGGPISEVLRNANMGEVVAWIQGNQAGWSYDNCKVAPGDFSAGQLKSVLFPFIGRVTLEQCRSAWLAAVREAHAFTVDGMTKTSPAAVCIGAWKRVMAEPLTTDRHE